MALCACTEGSVVLPSIENFTCGQSFGQIQKIAFQRLYDDSGNRNKFVGGTGSSTNPINKKASWAAFIAETDETKISVTPFVEAPTQEGGDPITYGGGNDTLGGAEQITGSDATTITFALRKYPQSVIKELKKLICMENLGVYLFSQDGQIEAQKIADNTYAPLPIRSFFVGDKIHGGLEEPDSNTMQFAFLPNYSDDLEIITPDDFNPLYDLG